jgi:hypothetical protein
VASRAMPRGPAAAAAGGGALLANYTERLMVAFADATGRDYRLPQRTDVLCFWCCHGFTTPPCVLPSHITRDVWHVYGNFCSPQCAAAHLFHERLDAHVQWERHALLNRLYPSATGEEVRPAPDRAVLTAFGGAVSIDAYRALLQARRVRVDVLTPPMLSITQTMDTKPIDFYDRSLCNVFVNHDATQRMGAAGAGGAQGLRLRRTKPVKEWESSLEAVMRIRGT